MARAPVRRQALHVIDQSVGSLPEPHALRGWRSIVFAPVGEINSGADHQVLDGAGDQYFSCRRLCPDPRRYVDRKPAEVIAADLAFPGVEAGAKAQSETLGGLPDRPCAANRPCGPVERGHETVAGGLDLIATKTAKLFPYGPIVVV